MSSRSSSRCDLARIRATCLVPAGFALWYALNVAYNITNKWALECVHSYVEGSTDRSSALPFTIGCLQFGVGALYACTLWGLGWRRPVPHVEELKRAAASLTDCVRKACRRVARLARVDRFLVRRSADGGGHPQHHHHHHRDGHSPASPVDIRHTFRIAIYHTFGQLCTVISLSANSISFAHVVKAMEPLFSALASRFVLGHKMGVRVYLSLIPVVGGVVMACAGSHEFSWLSFCAGMGSNAFFAMRSVASKIAMERVSSAKNVGGGPKLVSKDSNVVDEMNNEESNSLKAMDVESDGDSDKDHTHHQSAMSPANLFGAVTCISFCLSIPIALMMEGDILMGIAKADAAVEGEAQRRREIMMHVMSSGLFHYLNNEVMYLVLSSVHPVTLAVGNTMKRVFIIVAGVIVFGTPMTVQSIVGSTIGIGGVLLYSMMKQMYGSTGGRDGQSGLCAKGQ